MNDKRYSRRGSQQAKGRNGQPRSTSSANDRPDFFRFDARIQAPDFVLRDLEDEHELEYGPLDDDELTYEDDGDFLDHQGVQPPAQPKPKVTRKSFNRPEPKSRTVRRPAATPSYRKPAASRQQPMTWQDDDPFFDEEEELGGYGQEPVFGPNDVDVYEAEDGYYDGYQYEEEYEAAYAFPRRARRPALGQPQPRQLIFVMVGIILVAFLLMSRPLTSSFMDAMARSQGDNITASISQTAAADTAQNTDDSRPALWGGLRSSQLAPFFSQSVLYWEDDIVAWAERHNLDPNMVATVMQIESCGDPRAISSAGAMGLFQVMPFHFQAGEDGFDPDTNALRGMNYLAERLIQTNGEIGHAFAGYNGGHIAASGNWNSWANETQRYYKWTTGVYSDALNGNRRSTTIDEWLAAGGASLCIQAEQRLGLN